MDASEVLEVHTASVGDASHLLIIFFVGVGKSDLVVEVKHGPNGKVGNSFFEEFRYLLRNTILDLLLDVIPQFLDEVIEFLLEQLTLRQAHLVHRTIDMDQFHAASASADLMQLPIFVILDESGLFPIRAPDRLIIHIVFSRFSVAVCAKTYLKTEGS